MKQIALAVPVLLALLACKQADEKPAVLVKATDMINDYQTNEVGADLKYKGKRVRVIGVAGVIKKDILNTAYLTMKGSDSDLREVQAFFRSDSESDMASLIPGHATAIDCKGDGLMINVILRDCRMAPKPAAKPGQ